MAKITKVTIHITASNDNATPEDIEKIHIANGWSQCGYHWLVSRDGTITAMRPENLTGAHVAGHNTGNIGISYIARGSDKESDSPFAKFMTSEQMHSLVVITATMCKKYKLKTTDIWGHNDYEGVAKACPCFKVKKAKKFLEDVQTLMNELPENVSTIPEQALSVDGEDAEGSELAHKAIRSK